MITYSPWSGATPAFSSAPLIANPPSSAPVKPLRPPSNRPIGVRAPATMTLEFRVSDMLSRYLRPHWYAAARARQTGHTDGVRCPTFDGLPPRAAPGLLDGSV